MKLVSIKNISVDYDGKQALSGASLDIYEKDFIGIIGPNGGGKTTLVKSIMGIVPYKGTIEFADGVSTAGGTIGYLPQQNNFDNSFPISIKEVVLSGLQSRHNITGKFNSNDRAKAEAIMELTGINSLAKKSIGEISGGEMQRTLLCRAIISEPKLLILDEPANFVDNKFEKELYDILIALNERMAIIMVSHDIGTITSYVKSIVCVNKSIHRHDTNEVTPELLMNYNCPIQLVTHGEIPHTVLMKH